MRPPARATEPRALGRLIVVPVGSPPWSRWAIPFAATVGRGTGAGLVLYWAIAAEGQREQTQYRLDAIVADLGGSGLSATTRIDCRADVAQGILEAAAATDAALIALATKSKSHLDRWLNDSVADEVLRQADVPVLIVPHGLTHLPPPGALGRLIRVGRLADAVVAAAAAQGAHLIAMATHGRSGLARLRLGSVATATLHRSTVPVLVVRPGAAPLRLAP